MLTALTGRGVHYDANASAQAAALPISRPPASATPLLLSRAMDFLDAGLSFDANHPRPDRSEYIHAAVLFADVENSVMLSSALPPAEYDLLMQVFQHTMLDLAEELRREGFPLVEVRIKGD